MHNFVQDFPEIIELLFNLTRTSNTTSVLVLANLLGVAVDQLSSASFEEEIFKVLNEMIQKIILTYILAKTLCTLLLIFFNLNSCEIKILSLQITVTFLAIFNCE